MELNYSYIASSLSTEELLHRIDHREKYMPESIEAAVHELQFRKHEFTGDELRQINEDVSIQRVNAANFNGRKGAFSSSKGVTVIDPDAPMLYSLTAIRVFTILCGAFFGSILMAINLNKVSKGIYAFYAIIFGIIFTAAQYFLQTTLSHSGSPETGAFLGGLVASYMLDFLFWKNIIGYATFYRKKPIWIPLIIAIVIFGLLITAAIIGEGAQR